MFVAVSRVQSGPDLNSGRQPARFAALPSFRFHLLARLLERHSERWFQARFGLSLPEVRAVAITGSARQLTLKRLCQKAEMDRSQGSRLITRLVERGLMVRLEHPEDQRSALLKLTKRGEKLYPDLLAAATQRNEGWLAVIPRDARETLMQNVELLISQLRSDVEVPLGAELEAMMEMEPLANIPPVTSVDTETIRQIRDMLNTALGEGGG